MLVISKYRLSFHFGVPRSDENLACTLLLPHDGERVILPFITCQHALLIHVYLHQPHHIIGRHVLIQHRNDKLVQWVDNG
jgi:hypothetical protein